MLYISLLRGINVGGHKMMKMDALRKMLENLHYTQVKTYIQSGNIIFETIENSTSLLVQQIREAIQQTFGFEVEVMVLEVELFRQIASENPFLSNSAKDSAFFHVSFLGSQPEQIDFGVFEQKKSEHEAFFIHSRAVYLYTPKGYSQGNISNDFIEKNLKVKATTRNWKTVQEILKMISE